MTGVRSVLAIVAMAVLAACQTDDLAEPPVNLGDFALGLNVVVADNVQMVPLSRKTTPDAWEAAMKKAIDDRFGAERYDGTRLYNIGIAVEGYALAPPGVPLVLKPKSILVVTANVWDDATETKLNAEGKQFHIFEKSSPETVVGSGLTQSKARQMEILSYNAAKRVEQWFLDNPEWFGLPPKTRFGTTPATPAVDPTLTTAIAPVDQAPAPVAGAPAPVAEGSVVVVPAVVLDEQ